MGLFSNFIKKKEELDFLIVGLGNPDKIYLDTRHNIGWMVADKFAKKHKLTLNVLPKFKGQFAILSENGVKTGILKPLTYMNRSGISVSHILENYEIDTEKVIIVIDEYNFPVGKLKLNAGGSDGGHNGMTSIMEFIPENNFQRLRCGIDRKFGPGELVDYVLSPFGKDEIENLEIMINNAVTSLDYLIRNPLSRAVSFINSGKLWKNEEKADQENNIASNRKSTD
jgi:PTH1 family peptidyl-tRNA hydrolase